MPVVSVVVPFLNAERYLEEAVKSVGDQTSADWELILVDDGSTDRSTLMARDLAAKDGRIRYVDHPAHQNLGRSASRNLGAAHAVAPYIAFLDADDAWTPEKLSEQVELLEKMPDVALVAGATLYWYSWDPASTKADRVGLPGGIPERRLDPPESLFALFPLNSGYSVGLSGLLVRRSAFDAVGGFEERFLGHSRTPAPGRGLYDDQVLFAKIFLRYPIYISSRTWHRYRQHDTSCCAHASRADHVREREAFVDWLERYVGPRGDARVVAAVRRARRELPYRRLTAPAYEVFDRLPEHFQRRLRALAGRTLD